MSLLRKIKKQVNTKKAKLFGIVTSRRKGSSFSPNGTAFLEMTIRESNRRLFLLASFLKESGYNVAVFMTDVNFLKLDKIGVSLFKKNGIYRVSSKKKISECSIIISDSNQIQNYKSIFPDKRVVSIDYIYFSKMNSGVTYNIESDIVFPIHFYPTSLSKDVEQKAVSLGKSSKKEIGVFFAGTFLEENYGNPIIKSFDGKEVHSRIATYKFIKENCSDLLYMPTSFHDLKEKMASGFLKDNVVIVDIDEWRIPTSEYFEILSKCSFFIQMVGCQQPLCHNMYESMAAGCIPITEFPSIFFPPLSHGENAVVYSGLRDLRNALEDAIRMMQVNDGKLEKLRAGIAEYYDAYCSFDSFSRRICDRNFSRIFTLPPITYTKKFDIKEN